jgi:hypothetical protein
MQTDRERFEAWFARPLECLYPQAKEKFGIIIVMVILPLLERYLRQKVNFPSSATKDERLKAFCAAFEQEFPLGGKAEEFWTNCRHGLLHQGTFNRYGVFIVHDQNEPLVLYGAAPNETFRLNPVAFAQKVLATILSDFDIYSKAEPPLLRTSWLEGLTQSSSDSPQMPRLTTTLGTGAPLAREKPSNMPDGLKDITLA